MILQGDCVEAMAAMDEASVDAIVTDPPYGLEFMGHNWDRLWGTDDALPRTGPKRNGNWNSDVPRPRYEAGAAAQVWHQAWATEALRILRPGGHLLAFGGTRTYHRLACAVEDAGFEIRDSLIWIYGSGFPKSLDVSKAIDKAAGAEREVVSRETTRWTSTGRNERYGKLDYFEEDEKGYEVRETSASATPEAQQWQGWGTALKPAHEPIVVARKPLAGTVAANVLEHGTGALNVDGCRVGTNGGTTRDGESTHLSPSGAFTTGHDIAELNAGRWPANVTLSHLPECERVGTRRVRTNMATSGESQDGQIFGYGNERGKEPRGHADPDGTETIPSYNCAPGCPIAELDRQSGELTSGNLSPGHVQGQGTHTHEGGYVGGGVIQRSYGGDTGGASRFFATFDQKEEQCDASSSGAINAGDGVGDSSTTVGAASPLESGEARFRYCAKASRGERNAGLDGFEKGAAGRYEFRQDASLDGNVTAKAENVHPTVKPIDLMRWLVRLVTPPGGTVLDPFCGSGTTGVAATLEGVDFIGCELDPEYAEIAKARIEWWSQFPLGTSIEAALGIEVVDRVHRESGQMGLFAG